MRNVLTFVFFLFYFSVLKVQGQNYSDSIPLNKPIVNLSGFIDVFYAYDFNEPFSNIRQPFFYNHNRHNEFSVNLGLLSLKVNHMNYRANLGLQGGTYANDNYSEENTSFQLIHEANIGLLVSNKHNIWLDVGIFPSHIGFESAVSMDNLTLSRSLVAENSPYFLTGMKATCQVDPFILSLILSNGWQRIRRVEGNSLLSIGTQVSYNTDKNISLNWSSFVTTEDPDALRRIMIFNNLYAQVELNGPMHIIAGFDWGMQQQVKGSSSFDTWIGSVFIFQYGISEVWKTAVRAEYYRDESGVIIDLGSPNGFKTSGLSVNVDRHLFSQVVWRLECRLLKSTDRIFPKGSVFKEDNFTLLSSLALKFDK